MKYILPINVVLVLGLAGCSTMQISTSTADDVNLSAYSTFDFLEIADEDTDPAHFSLHDQQRVTNAITAELEGRGYQKAADPELKIALYLTVSDEKRRVSYVQYIGGPGNYGRHGGYGVRWLNNSTINYKAGTLVVDLVDVAQDQLVSQGVIDDEFFESDKLSNEDLRKAFAKLFADFPTKM